ncbi:MAG TPA: hypothetical protein PLP23_10695 [Panacibacter sp.]|nr:hypothetical protein [Panacibacter sp.]
MFYISKNTGINRKAGLTDKTIQVLSRKNGLVYFLIFMESGRNEFAFCEENLFEKEFSPFKNPTIGNIKVFEIQNLDLKEHAFKSYPITFFR